ncbi:hypothetical protein TSMEX_002146 [Taenia solium]|eukprot:TsM_000899400 transcript=TsM_000899400 gene=TsM_000899400
MDSWRFKNLHSPYIQNAGVPRGESVHVVGVGMSALRDGNAEKRGEGWALEKVIIIASQFWNAILDLPSPSPLTNAGIVAATASTGISVASSLPSSPSSQTCLIDREQLCFLQRRIVTSAPSEQLYLEYKRSFQSEHHLE